MHEEGSGELTLDALFDGAMRFRQMRGGHRIGTDTVLLVALAASIEGGRVVDLGAGAGGIGLTLLKLGRVERCTLVERDAGLAALARQNAELNGIGERVEIVAADVSDLGWGEGLRPAEADLVVCNPPFHDPQRHRPSPDPLRQDAHLAAPSEFDTWVAASARLLRPGGSLAMIYRADALRVVLQGLVERFGAVTVRPVHPKDQAPAARVLVTARRASKAPLQILPGLTLHLPDGRFTPLAEALHRGDFEAFPK